MLVEIFNNLLLEYFPALAFGFLGSFIYYYTLEYSDDTPPSLNKFITEFLFTFLVGFGFSIGTHAIVFTEAPLEVHTLVCCLLGHKKHLDLVHKLMDIFLSGKK